MLEVNEAWCSSSDNDAHEGIRGCLQLLASGISLGRCLLLLHLERRLEARGPGAVERHVFVHVARCAGCRALGVVVAGGALNGQTGRIAIDGGQIHQEQALNVRPNAQGWATSLPRSTEISDLISATRANRPAILLSCPRIQCLYQNIKYDKL